MAANSAKHKDDGTKKSSYVPICFRDMLATSNDKVFPWKSMNIPLDPFVHLRVHTAYSLCEGAIKIPDLVKSCIAKDLPAIAMTDTNNMFGAMEFALKCAENGIQPIVGSLLNLKVGEIIAPVIFLAQNENGYKNLLKLMTCFYIENRERDKYLSLENLAAHRDGLIVLSGGAKGPAGIMLVNNAIDGARRFLLDLSAIFPGNFYIEISRTDEADEKVTESFFIDFAIANDIPLVATNDVFFLESSMHKAHDILMCIADGTYITTKDRRRISREHYLKSTDEMFELFSDVKEAVRNTSVIAKRCNFMPIKKKPAFPKYLDNSGNDEDSIIEEQAKIGLKQRIAGESDILNSGQDQEKYFNRLEYELAIIKKMGFSGYFLIVSDFVIWAKEQGIPVGPGRGSGAGSVVAWSLCITDLDPIKYNLLFERFLNPDRISMPDFDIDFCQERRDEVIHYVKNNYGEKKVAHIIALGTLQARAVIRDVGRVIQMPYGQVDRISKLVPNNPANPVDLSHAIAIEPQFKDMMAEDETVAFLLDTALQLEGLYRHASLHAAGIVIGNEDIDELVPLYSDDESDLSITQFNMKFVESAGLVKFDFLGLKTLTLIKLTCDNVKKYQGIDIDISKINLEDEKTLNLLCKVDVVGIFQLESSGMKDVIQKLQPDGLEDLVALVSLYRPGPIDDVPKYLARKHGKEPVTYLHPMLEPILKSTYGVMVYQEQVMKIAQEMGGYSLAAADLLRRAMGKKIREEMERNREIFVSGAVNKGISQDTAKQVFSLMEKFASYGFNRSHAVPYALLSYQTAYLKANFRREFYIAIMNLDIGNSEKISLFVRDAKNSRIDVLGPDVNISEEFFMADGESKIRYALGCLRGCSTAVMGELVRERMNGGQFSSISNFFERIRKIGLSSRHVEALILAGALDSLHHNRRSLVESIDLLSNIIPKDEKDNGRQRSLFGESEISGITLRDSQEYGIIEKIDFERKTLGFYLSSHPMEIYLEYLDRLNITSSRNFEKAPENITVAGILLSKKEKLSKNGQKYAFLTISDIEDTFEVTVFPDLYSRTNALFQIGAPLVIDVQIKLEMDSAKLSAITIRNIDTILREQKVYLYLDHRVNVDKLYDTIETMEDGGNALSFIIFKENGKKLELETKHKKNLSLENRKRLKQIDGVTFTEK
ncbi:MAG: DNA polymerase III subunit alpha [Holosporales bacterium]|jgi:DNA polymerase-3 subunit alpha|nr:DNA polymerase III subunit alpha [Holosporales bacterium]